MDFSILIPSHNFLLFLAAALIIAAVPGPAILYVAQPLTSNI